MPSIWVDADACPFKDVIERGALRVGFPVTFVANRNVGVVPKRGVSVLVVSRGMDVADDVIAARVAPGDLVLTADIPLAAEALARGARCIDFRGGEFDAATIRGKLAAREMNETLRGGFTFTGGPSPLSVQDKTRFANTYDRVLTAMARDGK
ncbi:MAG: YaiI/YqxD family protein [Myxococcota bacterium]